MSAVDLRASLRFSRACLGQAASSSSISHEHLEGKKRPQAAPVLYLSELNEPLSLFVAPGASHSPLFPQDKESSGSDASHEVNAVAFSRSLRLARKSTAR